MESFFDVVRRVEDVQTLLIAPGIRESESLDYIEAAGRFGDSGKNENVSKIAGAMANTVGGTIVYGVACDPNEKDLPKEITGVDPINVQAIEGVLRDGLEPELSGWQVNPFPSAEKPQVVLVKVPASDGAPHQCKHDRKYYGRKGSHSKPLAHHEIAQIMLARQTLARLAEPLLVFEQVGSVSGGKFGGMLRNVGGAVAVGVELSIAGTVLQKTSALAPQERVDRTQTYYEVPGSAWSPMTASRKEMDILYHDLMGSEYKTVFQVAFEVGAKAIVSREFAHFKNGRRLHPR